MIKTSLCSSLVSVMPTKPLPKNSLKNVTICKNEPFSFQLAYKIAGGDAKSTQFFIRVKGDLPITNYYINCVPVLHTDVDKLQNAGGVGLYPDILMPKKVNPQIKVQNTCGGLWYTEKDEDIQLFAFNDSSQAVWYSINENGSEIPAGNYKLTFEIYGLDNKLITKNSLNVEVLDALLPKQSFIYTNWFHCDCLAKNYGIKIFSDKFFTIMASFLKTASQNGMNMVLLPAFTPALDTPIGGERATAQLVGVTKNGDKYEFDFSLMERYIRVAQANGIVYFEHCHMFTQWGSAFAPKIMAKVNGKSKQIFGWKTPAASKEYTNFLRCYLKAFNKFIKSIGLEKKILFHVSDEPCDENYKNYETAYNLISDLISDYMAGDALSDPKFYESGLVKVPIASTRRVAEFVGKGDNIWCYYTGLEIDKGMSNRLIQLPRQRNRMLGIQMYYYNIKGFLHWGYNYYFCELSHGRFNPAINSCGFGNAGTSYSVYPAPDGTAYQSVRQKNFGEGIVDYRLLQLLESIAGRKVVDEVIVKHFGVPDFTVTPTDAAAIDNFRNEVEALIKANIK